MDIHDSTTQYYALFGTAVALLLAFLLYQPTGIVKWLQKKNYQYEVTFALYMLTPTEKFIFNSVLFLTLSMLTLACIVYLPDHVVTMSRRTYYYFAGEAGWPSAAGDVSKQAAQQTATRASVLAESVYQAVANATAVAKESTVGSVAAGVR